MEGECNLAFLAGGGLHSGLKSGGAYMTEKDDLGDTAALIYR